jgi:hypothetical protein
MFMIDHAEQRRVEPPEPAPVEGADYEKTKASPGASNHNHWVYIILFLSYL